MEKNILIYNNIKKNINLIIPQKPSFNNIVNKINSMIDKFHNLNEILSEIIENQNFFKNKFLLKM